MIWKNIKITKESVKDFFDKINTNAVEQNVKQIFSLLEKKEKSNVLTYL